MSLNILSLFFLLLSTLKEIDVKAGGGKTMTIGEMVLSFMTRLEWFDTRFPRIPVNVQVSTAILKSPSLSFCLFIPQYVPFRILFLETSMGFLAKVAAIFRPMFLPSGVRTKFAKLHFVSKSVVF